MKCCEVYLNMKLSAKARYGLAALISMAESRQTDEITTVIRLSEKLQISKIYLEQVFSLLKRGGVVTATKGARGGYRLSRPANDITVFDIVSSIEQSLFEKMEPTVPDSDEHIERVMRETVFSALDDALTQALKGISLEDMLSQVEKYRAEGNYMYYL